VVGRGPLRVWDHRHEIGAWCRYKVLTKPARAGNAFVDGVALSPESERIAIEVKSPRDDIIRGVGQCFEALAAGYSAVSGPLDSKVAISSLRASSLRPAMSRDSMADLRITLGLRPFSRTAWCLQRMKIMPILIGQNYRLTVKIDNLHFHRLPNVKVHVTISVKIESKATPFHEIVEAGDIAPRDSVNLSSTSTYLMRETGSCDMRVDGAFSGETQLNMMYQNRSNPTYLTAYHVEPWSSIVPRVAVLVTLMAIVVAVFLRR